MASAWAQSVTVWLVRKVLHLKMVCPSKTRLIRHSLLILNAGWAMLGPWLCLIEPVLDLHAKLRIYKAQQCLVPQKAGEL